MVPSQCLCLKWQSLTRPSRRSQRRKRLPSWGRAGTRSRAALIKTWLRTQREHLGRSFTFFVHHQVVLVCGGIGLDAARRASEAVISLYQPATLLSVGFAGALTPDLHVGDLVTPSAVIDARDCSRVFNGESDSGNALLTFMSVAGVQQKKESGPSLHSAGRGHGGRPRWPQPQLRTGLAFNAAKVISDEADFELPEMDRFIDSQGRFKTSAFALFIVPRPWLWTRVVALARNSARAAKILSRHLERMVQELKVNSTTQPPPRPATPRREPNPPSPTHPLPQSPLPTRATPVGGSQVNFYSSFAGILLAVAPLAAQSTQPVIYAESFRRGRYPHHGRSFRNSTHSPRSRLPRSR